jgi:nicotinate (nicotinamide) nucleotide adenylyltransferase
MEFLWRGGAAAEAAAVFPGAWNPPTLAHLAMAEAALAHAPEVILAIARAMPHKRYEGAPFERRCEWLRAICRARPGLSAAITDGGLFVEMAREARAAAGARRVFVVCGRDAAERIVNWDYGAGPSIAEQLEEFELLVAPRGGEYIPPPELAGRIHALTLPREWEEVSSTEVRRRRARGEPWRHLVPAEVGEI